MKNLVILAIASLGLSACETEETYKPGTQAMKAYEDCIVSATKLNANQTTPLSQTEIVSACADAARLADQRGEAS